MLEPAPAPPNSHAMLGRPPTAALLLGLPLKEDRGQYAAASSDEDNAVASCGLAAPAWLSAHSCESSRRASS